MTTIYCNLLNDSRSQKGYVNLDYRGLVLEEGVELGSRGIPNNTTALLRRGILLKYSHYNQNGFTGKRWSLGAHAKPYGGIGNWWSLSDFFLIRSRLA